MANVCRNRTSSIKVISIRQCRVVIALASSILRTSHHLADWPRFNEVYREYFSEPWPARSAFGANGLALGARVEIEVFAVRR
jgi:enamine deaminase RidA (YjgF/YER057c/UK114 family)